MTRHNFISTATEAVLCSTLTPVHGAFEEMDRVGVKASQFSFTRLLRADPVLGVDMASTGEVACMGDNFYEALLKSMLSVGHRVPRKEKGVLLSSGPAKEKVELLEAAQLLARSGYRLFATGGTADFLAAHGVEAERLHWPDSTQRPCVIDYLKAGEIDLVVNIPKNHTPRELENGYQIRRTAIDYNVPLITNARLAAAYIQAFCGIGCN